MTPSIDVIFDGLDKVLSSDIPTEAKLFFAGMLTIKGFREGWLVSHTSFDAEQKPEVIARLEKGGWVEFRRESNGLVGLGLGRWAFDETFDRASIPETKDEDMNHYTGGTTFYSGKESQPQKSTTNDVINGRIETAKDIAEMIRKIEAATGKKIEAITVAPFYRIGDGQDSCSVRFFRTASSSNEKSPPL